MLLRTALSFSHPGTCPDSSVCIDLVPGMDQKADPVLPVRHVRNVEDGMETAPQVQVTGRGRSHIRTGIRADLHVMHGTSAVSDLYGDRSLAAVFTLQPGPARDIVESAFSRGLLVKPGMHPVCPDHFSALLLQGTSGGHRIGSVCYDHAALFQIRIDLKHQIPGALAGEQDPVAHRQSLMAHLSPSAYRMHSAISAVAVQAPRADLLTDLCEGPHGGAEGLVFPDELGRRTGVEIIVKRSRQRDLQLTAYAVYIQCESLGMMYMDQVDGE